MDLKALHSFAYTDNRINEINIKKLKQKRKTLTKTLNVLVYASVSISMYIYVQYDTYINKRFYIKL